MSLTRPVNGQTYNGEELFGEYADAIENNKTIIDNKVVDSLINEYTDKAPSVRAVKEIDTRIRFVDFSINDNTNNKRFKLTNSDHINYLLINLHPYRKGAVIISDYNGESIVVYGNPGYTVDYDSTTNEIIISSHQSRCLMLKLTY